MVAGNHLWNAMEDREEFLHSETGLRGRSASDVPGRDVPRDPDESQRVQYADDYGGLSESVAEAGGGNTVDIMQHGTPEAKYSDICIDLLSGEYRTNITLS